MGESKNFHDEIVRVAYELYEKRGMAHGHDFEDWIEAERIVCEGHAKEIEQGANIIRSIKGMKASGKSEAKTLKISKKTSESSSQTKPKKGPPKKKT